MKRHVLYLCLLALAGLIFSSSAAGALDYPVYKLVPRAAKMTFAAFAAGTSLDSAVVDYVVTDPEKDSTITTLHVGDRMTIEAGGRVYLADADTFTFTQIGGSSAGALVLLAPGAYVSDSSLSPLRIQGSKNNLTQILGPGIKYHTKGLLISNEVEVQNTLLAGHEDGVWLDYRDQSIKFKADALYTTNTDWGFTVLPVESQFLTNNHTISVDFQNAVSWNNAGVDMGFRDVTMSHLNLLAKNCKFLSRGRASLSVSADFGNEAGERKKYTLKFVDCVFSINQWTWTPGEDRTRESTDQNDGVVLILETRPGRNELVQVWPLTGPIDPADFNVDGVVDLTDFTLMSADFGRNVGESRFARYYDMSKDGLVDLHDNVLWMGDYLGLAPDTGTDVLADQLANTTAGKNLLQAIATNGSTAVVAAIMADPVLRPALEPFLKMTAVEEEDTTTPTATALGQNYPNPFNPATAIRFDLAKSGDVQVLIYNLSGQLVKTLLANTLLPAGEHQLQWDGVDANGHEVTSGTYICTLRAGKHIFTKKMLLLH